MVRDLSYSRKTVDTALPVIDNESSCAPETDRQQGPGDSIRYMGVDVFTTEMVSLEILGKDVSYAGIPF